MRKTLSPNHLPNRIARPVQILQFGTGALLRGLTDYIVHRANMRGDFAGGIACVASTGSGRTQLLKEQQGLFTHRIEGMEAGKAIEAFDLNQSIQLAYAATDEWTQVLTHARSTEVEIIISNTTEVGIQYQPDDLNASPPRSYPGKLTAFLHERFRSHPEKPLVILPTELLPDNGPKLQQIVLQHAQEHQLGEAFQSWIKDENVFCSTLVDRIVTGRPSAEKFESLSKELGYQDELLTVSEPYYLWAIEGPAKVKEVLTFAENDPGVVLTEDISPYRERKLRILNGSHTFLVGLAHLCGFNTVADCMEDPVMGAFVSKLIHKEIVPSLPTNITGGAAFGDAVMDRFRNPYLHHKVLDITLQYTTKMDMRNAESVSRYMEKFQTVPPLMSLGIAAFLRFAQPMNEREGKFYGEWQEEAYLLRDDRAQDWANHWENFSSESVETWVSQALRQIGMGNMAPNGLTKSVSEYLITIQTDGPKAALEKAVS